MTLEELGYIPKFFNDGRWPSELWTRVSSNGYHVQELTFDTIHGGPWTFECFASVFFLKDEDNWTTQERLKLNPASRDFIGSNVGHWSRAPAILTAQECYAVAEHIHFLESERTRRGDE